MAKGISAEAREDILVQAFLTCPNISEISKKTKIPRPTIYTVIHSDSFQRKYSEARNEAVTGAIAYLQGKLGECAAVLVNTATDTEVPAQIRVNAANAALSQCSQWTKNVDVIERLKAMEELMSQVEQNRNHSGGGHNEYTSKIKASRRTGYAIAKESRYYSLDHGKACSRKGKTLYNIGRRWYLQ